MVSKYHRWFREMGYPQLDIQEYPDGSWSIIEYLNCPVIPSLTRWNVVLANLEHIEPSYSFCEKYVQMMDTQKRWFWDLQDLKERQLDEESDALERHAEELGERAHFAVTHNPAMMDRIAKNGMGELNLAKIAKHIPRSAGRL
jgi:hypothetical protein